jgi:putative membrane protein
MRSHEYYMHGGDGPHVFAWLLLALLLVLLVGLVVAIAARWGGLHRGVAAAGILGSKAGADARELVRLRYARGEIDRETFLQMSQDLGGGPPSG